jgi:multiple sugar transport system ATP-binding protein
MRTELSKLHNRLGTTFIYVTHDQTEAMTMGDRIVVMKDGIVQQVDTPQNLYEQPANLFVAGFMGSPAMNFIDAKIVSNNGVLGVEFGYADGKAKYCINIPEGKVKDDSIKAFIDHDVILGIRPENIHDDEMFLSMAKDGIVEADVEVTELMGAETYLYLNLEGTQITARVDPRSTAKQGDKLKVAFDLNKIHLFDKDTEKVILN